jgi:hypothetical protein
MTRERERERDRERESERERERQSGIMRRDFSTSAAAKLT